MRIALVGAGRIGAFHAEVARATRWTAASRPYTRTSR